MRYQPSRIAAAVLCGCLLSFLPVMLSCSAKKATFRVSVVGFPGGESEEARNALLEYASRRVEAELGAWVEVHIPEGSGGVSRQAGSGPEDADLLVTLGSGPPGQAASSGEGGEEEQAPRRICLDWRGKGTPAGGGKGMTFVRYRVEEGAYVCGFLAASLTVSGTHPLTNSQAVAAFVGWEKDPLLEYYREGFRLGFKAALPDGNPLEYLVAEAGGRVQARGLAEDAVKKGADILFCTPGDFNEGVLGVAESRGVLVILVGSDRSGRSPQHVLTSLVFRDDNAVFRAVELAMEGGLPDGVLEWGAREGVWSLAPFLGHDVHVGRELKEELEREISRAAEIELGF